MADPGFVDLQVQYKDAVTGDPVAVGNISGVVRNALGTEIESIIPIAFDDPTEGLLYQTLDYDLRDSSKFPGTFITVEWQADRLGVFLPTFDKIYRFRPVAEEAFNQTAMYWLAFDDPNTLFYEIERHRTTDAGIEEEIIGQTFAVSFIDTTVYTNEFEARTWQYRMYPALRTNTLNDDGTDYIISGSPQTAYAVFRTAKSFCNLSGHAVNLIGQPADTDVSETKLEQDSISFRVYYKDRHQVVGDAIILPETIYVKLSAAGRFEINLIQGTVVELHIPYSNYRGRFAVPNQAQATLEDLTIEIIRDK